MFKKFGQHTVSVHIKLWWHYPDELPTLHIYIGGSVFILPIVCFQLHLVPVARAEAGAQLYILLKFHGIEFPLWRLQIAILGPETLSLRHSLSWVDIKYLVYLLLFPEKSGFKSLAVFVLDIYYKSE